MPVDYIGRNAIIYSAGIGKDISFDLALIHQYGVEIHAFDPTPQSLAWLENQRLPEAFHYYPWGIADYDGTAVFHVPRNPSHISHSVIKSQATGDETVQIEVRRIENVMLDLGHGHIDLLKMDIEGAEYGVLNDLLSGALRPDLLLVEFHHRFRSIGASATKTVVRKLRESGYDLYAVSSSGEELCFKYRDDARNLKNTSPHTS